MKNKKSIEMDSFLYVVENVRAIKSLRRERKKRKDHLFDSGIQLVDPLFVQSRVRLCFECVCASFSVECFRLFWVLEYIVSYFIVCICFVHSLFTINLKLVPLG